MTDKSLSMDLRGGEGSREGVRGAHTGWEEGKGSEGKGRRREKGGGWRNSPAVSPLRSPAVGTPTGPADVMSEFAHLSWTPVTHTKIHTHNQGL